MSELNFLETNQERDRTASDKGPGRPYGITQLGTVGLIAAFVLTSRLWEKLMPDYVAMGISCFALMLFLFRWRAPKFRNYDFWKWTLLSLLPAAAVSALWFVLNALWVYLVKR